MDLHLAFLWPIHLKWIFTRAWHDLMEICLIVQIIPTFSDMSSVLLSLLELEELPLLGFFDRVEVFLFEVVALDATLVLMGGH